MNIKLKALLEQIKYDMKHNTQQISADYPHMTLIKLLEILIKENDENKTD